MIRFLIVALVAVSVASSSGAQSYGGVDDVQVSAPGYFFFARPGQPVVTVTAVGALPARGRYALGEGATVADLLALAGGASVDRTGRASVRLYRAGRQVIDVDARDLFGEDAMPVLLREGDVVEVVGLTSTAPGFYVHTQPGARPIIVTVAGAVSAPGRFFVDPGTTVGDLLALAGGTRGGVEDSRVETTPTVRLHRDGSIAFEGTLTETYARPTPVLQDGDVVELEIIARRRNPFTWRDALSLVTTGLAVLIAVDRLTQ